MSGGGGGGGNGGGGNVDANRQRSHHHNLPPLRVPISGADARNMELQPILTTPAGLSDAGASGWADGNGGHSSSRQYHFDADGATAAAAAPLARLLPRPPQPPPPPPPPHFPATSSASTSGNDSNNNDHATPAVSILQAPRNLPNPAPSAVWRVAARNLVLILTWYFFSTCLSLWNRTLLGHGHGVAGRGAFPAPMFMTAMQFCVQIAMARFALWMGVEGKGRSRNGDWRNGGRRAARRSGFGGGGGASSKEEDEQRSRWQQQHDSAAARGVGRRRAATAAALLPPSQHRRWNRLSGDADQPELAPSAAAPCLLPPTSSLPLPSSSSPPRSASASPNNRSPSSFAAAAAGNAAGTTATIQGTRSSENEDECSPLSPPSSSSPASSQLSWRAYFTQVVPNGVCTGLDIGLSNFSLSLISLSFYTMCKSTTPLFLLAFAFAWGLEKPSWSLAGVVAVISSGLMLLVYGEAHFDGVGFALVMTASALSGLRWTITQVLLQGGGGGAKKGGATGGKSGGSNNSANGKVSSSSSPPRSPRGASPPPGLEAGGGSGGHGGPAGQGPVAVVAALMPVMALTVALVSLLAERLWVTLPGSPYFDSLESVSLTLGLVAGGAAIAFAMVWVEFTVIKLTSALTFMVAGTFKEIVTVLAAVVFLGESFSRVNAAGLAVLVAGVALFNYTKYKKVASEQREQEQQRRRKEQEEGEEEEREGREAAAAAALSPVVPSGVPSAAAASALHASNSTSSSSAGNSGEFDVRGIAAVAAARKRRGGGDSSSVEVDVVDDGVIGLGASASLVVDRTATPPGSATAAATAGGAGGGGSPLRPRGAAGGER